MLYLCATPIGNLGDITIRVMNTLRDCDAVYCEDTRHTLQLLNHLEVKKPLISCHQHNERQRAEEAIAQLRVGKDLVYVSDAGMPGISDPGAALVEACIREELPFTVLPGASAVLTAAVMSGLPPAPFTFFGFLPREGKGRKAAIEQIKGLNHQTLLYESPQRMQKTLTELLEQLGDCRCAVLRELTKKFEEVRRGRLSELIPQYQEPPKGECVIALLPEPPMPKTGPEALDQALRAAFSTGLLVKDAAAKAAGDLHIPKREAYARALALVSQKKEPL